MQLPYVGGNMTRESILEYAAAVRRRYRKASKAQKGLILTEFCLTTGYHRKSAIRLLNRKPQGGKKGKRGRPREYGHEITRVLKIAWEATGRVCSKLLAPFMPELIETLERHGEIAPSPEVREKLLRVSPATIDRLLKPFRLRPLRRPYAKSRAASLLRNKIAMRTFAELRGLEMGHLEVDLVLHCGMSTEGFYLATLVGVDIATGWTECVPVWGKTQSRVGSSVDRIRRQVPFKLLGIHSDNGSEFINHPLYDYCRRHDILFTRSRPYKKNDQPRVEQKNGALVRHLVGYGRYTTRAAYEQLGRVYALVRLHTNFFQPMAKLVDRIRHGAKVHKQYDRARTPHQRLLALAVLNDERSQELEKLYRSLNPLQLHRHIDQELEKLWRLEAVDPASELAARVRAHRVGAEVGSGSR
jgi:hypothetical protein